MVQIGESSFWVRRELRVHLETLGLERGDAVMVHAAMRKVGPLLNGPDILIGALLDVLGPEGTLLSYTDWDANYDDAADENGRVPDELKPDIPPFDPLSSRASRDHGVISEFIRTHPNAVRSGGHGASVAAIGGRAEWFTADHPLNYGYGEGSPFAKLVEAQGKVLMIGAPLDTMSILHHAEHLAPIAGKRVHRIEVPLLIDNRVEWHLIEEFDTANPVVEGLAEDYFAEIVRDYLQSGRGRQGPIASTESVLVDAAQIVDFGVQWLVTRCG